VRELSVRYGIHSTQVNQWKAQLREAATSVFENPSARRGEEAVKDAELFEQIGRLKMELEWLKKKFSGPGL
jgi:transposase-like protein